MDEYFFLFLLISLILLGILYSFQKNYLIFLERGRKNEYYIKKAKIKREFEDEDDDDEPRGSNSDIPKWLYPIIEGAGLDVDKLEDGDVTEMKKANEILERLKQNPPGNQAGNDRVLF